MNRHQRRIDDEDDAFDENGVLKDGHRVRVPLMMMDGMQRDVRDHVRIHDGHGNRDIVGHRPGFLVSDARANDARAETYDAYNRELVNAWRGGCDARKVTQRDPRGRLLSTFEEETDDALPARDGLTLDKLQQDHQRRMSREYQAYDGWIAQQWRNP
jgi:hypothetical protein